MKSVLNQLLKSCNHLDVQLIKDHCNNLESNYFSRFCVEKIADHLSFIDKLVPSNPVEISMEIHNKSVDITIYSFDRPFMFAAITGIIGSFGLNICSGEAFTYAHDNDFHKERCVIDHFVCSADSPVFFPDLLQKLKSLLTSLNALTPKQLFETKREINETTTNTLKTYPKSNALLLPIKIYVKKKKTTSFKIIGEDTPFFLYTLSSAFSRCGVLIKNVQIQTQKNKVIDTIEVVDQNHQKITDPDEIKRIKCLITLTKQFTYHLVNSTDPYKSLVRFEHLVENFLDLTERRKWLKKLSNFQLMFGLAKVLGASDALWNKFIWGKYETLIVLLEEYLCKKQSYSSKNLKEKINTLLLSCKDIEEKKRCINDFKDREIFAIKLNQILYSKKSLKVFSTHLAKLAEVIIATAANIAYQNLSERFGCPGKKSNYVIMGLGKLGGRSLGYASDLELMLVYEADGITSSDNAIDNLEFFQYLTRDITRCIQTQTEGIFKIDLKLRPYGEDGPLATSVETFCEYYGPKGNAHSLEKLALVQMRTICGSRKLGKKIELLRDEYLYQAKNISVSELHEARKKQLEVKEAIQKPNAKYSLCTLVDIEYHIQILQVLHLKQTSQVTTIYKALNALSTHGILSFKESLQLKNAYNFFVKIINALRMQNGNAKDLFLPTIASMEFTCLTRRVGCTNDQLCKQWQTHTLKVRSFVEKHFGKNVLPFKEKYHYLQI